MLNPYLSDSQINQLFFIDDNGFIRRKKITGYIQLSNVIKLLWNRKANQIITAPSIKITGYKREKTEYIKDVLLFGREVADKKADAAKIARYKDKKIAKKKLKALNKVHDITGLNIKNKSILGEIWNKGNPDAQMNSIRKILNPCCLEGYLDTYVFYKTEYFGKSNEEEE